MPEIVPAPLVDDFPDLRRHNPFAKGGYTSLYKFNAANQLNDLPPEVFARELLNKRVKGLTDLRSRKGIPTLGGLINSHPLVGGDPEFFITDKDNHLVPSFDWLQTHPADHSPMTPICAWRVERKDRDVYKSVIARCASDIVFGGLRAAYASTELNNRGCSVPSWLHPDGYQLEFGYTPIGCMQSTASQISNVICNTATLLEMEGLLLSKRASVKVDLMQGPMVELGCRPSYNAWGDDNTITELVPEWRFGGGHFHFGMYQALYPSASVKEIDDPEIVNTINRQAGLSSLYHDERQVLIDPVVRVLDWTIGLITTAMARGYDDPKRRTHKYGMAGDYRLTSQTLEYRVPSNYVWTHPTYWHFIGMVGRYIIDLFFNPAKRRSPFDRLVNLLDLDSTPVRNAINQTDGAAAEAILAEHGIMKLLMGAFEEPPTRGVFEKLLAGGRIGPNDDILGPWYHNPEFELRKTNPANIVL